MKKYLPLIVFLILTSIKVFGKYSDLKANAYKGKIESITSTTYIGIKNTDNWKPAEAIYISTCKYDYNTDGLLIYIKDSTSHDNYKTHEVFRTQIVLKNNRPIQYKELDDTALSTTLNWGNDYKYTKQSNSKYHRNSQAITLDDQFRIKHIEEKIVYTGEFPEVRVFDYYYNDDSELVKIHTRITDKENKTEEYDALINVVDKDAQGNPTKKIESNNAPTPAYTITINTYEYYQ